MVHTTVGLATGGQKEPARCGALEKRLDIAVTVSDLGSDSPSRVTTTANLLDLGTSTLVAKNITPTARILAR
jgi:hypothetical protein